ncbi:hypothetical protein QAD02_017785 [Eretmocerus hayati]|uniref:Uncharacterized protein n=1 Tax=Eretmocerus hayati TaxID=131215 RepID=A0ACC2PFY9_9HYME|nr:hypothetical protein QAD02_017785 [Eretmocerus hayati]
MAVEPLCELTDLSLDDFLAKCVQSSGIPEIDGARIIICRNTKPILPGFKTRLIHEGFIRNSSKLLCSRITLSPDFPDPGLYTIHKEDCSHEFQNNQELLAHLAEQPDPSFHMKTDKEIIDGVPTRPPGIYVTGLESRHFVAGVLETNATVRTSNVHPSTNPDVKEMPGINTSMFYIGGHNSCSELHREDGLLAAVAALLARLDPLPEGVPLSGPEGTSADELPDLHSASLSESTPDESSVQFMDATAPVPTKVPCKVWMVPLDPRKLEDAIRAVVRSVPSSDESSSEPAKTKRAKKRRSAKTIKRRRCSRALDHKNIYANTDFMDRHGIPYVTFRQYENDVVYLRPGMPHEVIQIVPNCLEASNFGDAEWQVIADHVSFCGCEEQAVACIAKNPAARVNITQRHIKHHCDDCEFMALNKAALVQHCEEEHSKNIVTPRIRLVKKCPDCGTFTRRLDDHLRRPSQKHKGDLFISSCFP